MAKRIIVLGVSTFSEFLLRFLSAQHRVETIAVDRDEERINAITDFVDRPIIGSIRSNDILTNSNPLLLGHTLESSSSYSNPRPFRNEIPPLIRVLQA